MRLRFVFVGFPAVVAPPKRRADHHSRGASWVLRDELSTLRLRDPEVITWITATSEGLRSSPAMPTTRMERTRLPKGAFRTR